VSNWKGELNMSQPAAQFEGRGLPQAAQAGAVAAVQRAALSLVENEAEVTRWLLQQRFLSNMMGGPLPPMQSLSYVKRALDVGCGAGAWAQEVAHCYPNVRVVGIDKSAYFIEQARTFAAKLPNVTFLERDMFHLEGEPFSPGSIDLIHLRFMSGEVPFQRFPALIESLGRLCRRGGLFVSFEAELPVTSSSACDHLESLLLHTFWRRGAPSRRVFRCGWARWPGSITGCTRPAFRSFTATISRC
jgi:SAM-dependent methyltransferase